MNPTLQQEIANVYKRAPKFEWFLISNLSLRLKSLVNNSWISIIKLRCLPIQFTRVVVHGRLGLVIFKPNNTIFAVVALNCPGFITRDLCNHNQKTLEILKGSTFCLQIVDAHDAERRNHSQLSTENAPQILVIRSARRSVGFLIKIRD